MTVDDLITLLTDLKEHGTSGDDNVVVHDMFYMDHFPITGVVFGGDGNTIVLQTDE